MRDVLEKSSNSGSSKSQTTKLFPGVAVRRLKDEDFFTENHKEIFHEFQELEQLSRERELIVGGLNGQVRTQEDEDRFKEARKHKEQIFSTKLQKITLPFDINRVILEQIPDFYYNASVLNVEHLLESCLTQGPNCLYDEKELSASLPVFALESSAHQPILSQSLPIPENISYTPHTRLFAGQKPLTRRASKNLWLFVFYKNVENILALRWFERNQRYGQPNQGPEDLCYFPSEEDKVIVLKYTVNNLDEELAVSFVQRKTLMRSEAEGTDMLDEVTIRLKHKKEQRDVKIFIANWRDGEGFQPRYFWNLVSHWEQNQKNGFSFVHCTAGVGRTGTFLVTYLALLNLRKQLEIQRHNPLCKDLSLNIPFILATLRLQRPSLVETFPQYFSIYDNLSHLVEKEIDFESVPLKLPSIQE